MVKNAKKMLFYLGGIFLLAIGINIAKIAELGISPISSVPYAAELIWGIELGKATMIVFTTLIGLQILILRKDYKAIQLLQILCSYILSFFITYTSTNYLLFWLPTPNTYIIRIIYIFASILIMGIGAGFYLITDYIPLPPEGLVNAIVQASQGKIKFANAKIGVDLGMVLISATLSLIFLKQFKSVREGTILSAILVGKVIGFILKNYKERIQDWFEKNEIKEEDLLT